MECDTHTKVLHSFSKYERKWQNSEFQQSPSYILPDYLIIIIFSACCMHVCLGSRLVFVLPKQRDKTIMTDDNFNTLLSGIHRTTRQKSAIWTSWTVQPTNRVQWIFIEHSNKQHRTVNIIFFKQTGWAWKLLKKTLTTQNWNSCQNHLTCRALWQWLIIHCVSRTKTGEKSEKVIF